MFNPYESHDAGIFLLMIVSFCPIMLYTAIHLVALAMLKQLLAHSANRRCSRTDHYVVLIQRRAL